MSTGHQTGHRIEEKFICRTTPRRAYTVLPNACKCRSSDTSGSLGSHNSRGGLGGSHASMCSKSQRRDSGGQGTVQRKKSQSKHNSTHFAYDQNEYRHSPQQCPTSATAQCESATRQDSTSGATQGFYMRALRIKNVRPKKHPMPVSLKARARRLRRPTHLRAPALSGVSCT